MVHRGLVRKIPEERWHSWKRRALVTLSTAKKTGSGSIMTSWCTTQFKKNNVLPNTGRCSELHLIPQVLQKCSDYFKSIYIPFKYFCEWVWLWEQTCLFDMTFPEEKGFWKKSKITALLKTESQNVSLLFRNTETQRTEPDSTDNRSTHPSFSIKMNWTMWTTLRMS